MVGQIDVDVPADSWGEDMCSGAVVMLNEEGIVRKLEKNSSEKSRKRQ